MQTTLFVMRTPGSTLILTVTVITPPTTSVVAQARDGLVTARARDGLVAGRSH